MKLKDFFNPRLKREIKPQKSKNKILFYNPSQRERQIFKIGTAAFFVGLIYLAYLYLPLVAAFGRLQLTKLTNQERLARQAEIKPEIVSQPTPTLPPNPDPEFSIIIPKIDAEARVLDRVSVVDKTEYMEALKYGVAHAAGTGLPGEGKTIYLFAHSTNGEWNVVRYNAIFFLLGHLEPGDEIWLIYQNRLYPYLVVDQKVVKANDVSYLTDYQNGETLILQTCWPPGTILKRPLVFAQPKTAELIKQIQEASTASQSAKQNESF